MYDDYQEGGRSFKEKSSSVYELPLDIHGTNAEYIRQIKLCEYHQQKHYTRDGYLIYSRNIETIHNNRIQ